MRYVTTSLHACQSTAKIQKQSAKFENRNRTKKKCIIILYPHDHHNYQTSHKITIKLLASKTPLRCAVGFFKGQVSEGELISQGWCPLPWEGGILPRRHGVGRSDLSRSRGELLNFLFAFLGALCEFIFVQCNIFCFRIE